jgi:hypothetical protein
LRPRGGDSVVGIGEFQRQCMGFLVYRGIAIINDRQITTYLPFNEENRQTNRRNLVRIARAFVRINEGTNDDHII